MEAAIIHIEARVGSPMVAGGVSGYQERKLRRGIGLSDTSDGVQGLEEMPAESIKTNS